MPSRFLLFSFFALLVSSSSLHADVYWREAEFFNGVRIRVEVVTTLDKMSLGLGNRDGLKPKTGMLFVYSTGGERLFWMKRMRFAIDILWIHGNKIVHVERNVPPPNPMLRDNHLASYGRGHTADKILEVKAGFSDKHCIQAGQTLKIR